MTVDGLDTNATAPVAPSSPDTFTEGRTFTALPADLMEFPPNRRAEGRGEAFAESVIDQVRAIARAITFASEGHTDTWNNYLLSELQEQAQVSDSLREAGPDAWLYIGKSLFGSDLVPERTEGIDAQVALEIGSIYLQATKQALDTRTDSMLPLLLVLTAVAIRRELNR